jgi:hypothetical protein
MHDHATLHILILLQPNFWTASKGLILCDSRVHAQNAIVAHSIFTQKYRVAGDALPYIDEAPLFGSSTNHAGLQVADVLASALLFPMAARVYCAAHMGGVHNDRGYDVVSARYGARLQPMQHL